MLCTIKTTYTWKCLPWLLLHKGPRSFTSSVKEPQWNETQYNRIACIQVPATKTATSEWRWFNKREQCKMLNRQTTLSLIPLPLQFCQSKGQGQITHWEKVKRTTGGKELPHRIKLKVILFLFLSAAVTRSKEENEMHMYPVHIEHSLPFILPAEWGLSESNFLSHQLNPNCNGWSLFWNLPSISLVHLQRYFCCLSWQPLWKCTVCSIFLFV